MITYFRRFLFLFIGLLLLAGMLESCRPPRCNIPGCYVRMLHRHKAPGMEGLRPPNSDDPAYDASISQGKLYRGVPWWRRNKNPKIGDGYKVGYKYEYRKRKFRPKKAKQPKNVQEESIADDRVVTGEAAESAPVEKKSRKQKRAEKKQKAQNESPVIEENPAEEKEGF